MKTQRFAVRLDDIFVDQWPNKSPEPTAVGAVFSFFVFRESAVAQLSSLGGLRV